MPIMSATKEKNVDGKISLHAAVTDELQKIGKSGPWLWTLFFLCVTPNILNGFHVSSYIFLSQQPEDFWCAIPKLVAANWTETEIRNVTAMRGVADGACQVANWNFDELATLSYSDALKLVEREPDPGAISCRSASPDNHYVYHQEPGLSIVSEWDLICENTVWRTTVQVALSIGKFLGATTFGILSDKYGRKKAFVVACFTYIASGILTTFTPWYILLLIGRVGLGLAGSGVFYPAFTLLTENVSQEHRSWMSIAYAASYPFGMLFLALSAYFIRPWRHLQLILSLPAILLFIHMYFLDESPRWLLSKGRDEEAYKIVFRKAPALQQPLEKLDTMKTVTATVPPPLSQHPPPHLQLSPIEEAKIIQNDKKPPHTVECSTVDVPPKLGCADKLKRAGTEMIALYGPALFRKRILICHFTWCVTSLSYYITALNADNITKNRYLYVALTGLVDIPSYILSMILLMYAGRKTSACGLYVFAGACLLMLLAVPKDATIPVVTLALAGRFGISAVYAIVTLHTAELFPTQIRNSALGTSSTMAHVGSISAPYIVDFLGLIAWFIPTTISGSLVMVAAMLTLILPETKNRELRDNIQQESNESSQDIDNRSVDSQRLFNDPINCCGSSKS